MTETITATVLKQAGWQDTEDSTVGSVSCRVIEKDRGGPGAAGQRGIKSARIDDGSELRG